MEHTVFLSLGSNIGDRLANLRSAMALLSPDIHPLAQSSIYETEPWGYSDQPTFLNLVWEGSTQLDPLNLLSHLKQVENTLGRKETFRFGPRLIDLDILFYDDLVIDTPTLTIPHSRISERAFVLVPLAEIAPDFYHPVLKTTIQQLLSKVDTSGVKIYPPGNH